MLFNLIILLIQMINLNNLQYNKNNLNRNLKSNQFNLINQDLILNLKYKVWHILINNRIINIKINMDIVKDLIKIALLMIMKK